MLNYTLADEMLEFVRGHQIMVRGHNIFWEDPMYIPSWVRNLTGDALRAVVNSRIRSLLKRYVLYVEQQFDDKAPVMDCFF